MLGLIVIRQIVYLVGIVLFLGATAASAWADEVDELLAKRQNNFAKLKRLHIESTVDTERPAMAGKPARKLQMNFGFTIKPRDRNAHDPAKRFDIEMDMGAPMQMHVRMTNGEFSFQNGAGRWVTVAVPDDAKEFLEGLSDRHAGDVKGQREHFDIKRNPNKDNFWGTRKGLTFIPKGKAKLYERREEVVDVDTGQPVLVEHFNAKGECVLRLRVNKLNKHNGVAVADDVESESTAGIGTIKQRTTNQVVEVETE